MVCNSSCSYKAAELTQESGWEHVARVEAGMDGIASSSKSLQLGSLRQ